MRRRLQGAIHQVWPRPATETEASDSSAASPTSLATGGPFYRAVRGLGFSERRRTINRIVVVLALTCLPLLLMCVEAGTAWGKTVKVPLLHDFSMYGRFFVALPLLLVAEILIDPFIRRVVSILDSSGIVREGDLAAFRETIKKVARLRDSGLAELLLGLVAFFPFFLFVAEYEWVSTRFSTWHGTTTGGLSVAGWWFVLVSSPFLRFLMLRWLWRYALWCYVLRRLSKLNLALLPTHPDRLGGLGFLLLTQQQFGILAMALGAVLAGQFANEITYFGVHLSQVRGPTGVFIVISVLVILLPLTLFSLKLFETRRDGLIRYGVVARGITGKFDTKWIATAASPPDEMVGTQDPSSLIDYISSYDVIQQMRIIPMSKRTVLYIAAYAAAPFAVVWWLGTPVDQLIAEIVKRLF
jgi:hypothetical protein